LNLDCRDEIVPILRALQHLYEDVELRRTLLRLIGRDVNDNTSRRHGRRGMNYWEIAVLASARLGCNLDYDKLQDLAENHRRLRQIMGIGDWQDEEVDFDWRRIEDNLNKLTPETLQQINALIVQAGHALKPKAIQTVRGDSFVVETDIHYPTESTLIDDGLRKLAQVAAELAAAHELDGWRQWKHLLRKVHKLVREIGRTARAKRQGAERLKQGYKKLLAQAKDLLARARRLLRQVGFQLDDPKFSLDQVRSGQQVVTTLPEKLMHFVVLTERVCDNAQRRVLYGAIVPNEDKVFSIFEPHTELIKRGKEPNPIQFGHNVLVIEDAIGFVVDYRIVANGVLDQDLVVPVMKQLQRRFGGKIKSASFDRAFHTPENQAELADIVKTPCIAAKGAEQGREQHQKGSVAFRRARQHHPGVESAIGALQCGNGLQRCRDRSKRGYERYVGLGILGRNLHTLGKLLVAEDNTGCAAATSTRKNVA
jgi:IS5 family transposase